MSAKRHTHGGFAKPTQLPAQEDLQQRVASLEDAVEYLHGYLAGLVSLLKEQGVLTTEPKEGVNCP
jgi:hypothetical protein